MIVLSFRGRQHGPRLGAGMVHREDEVFPVEGFAVVTGDVQQGAAHNADGRAGAGEDAPPAGELLGPYLGVAPPFLRGAVVLAGEGELPRARPADGMGHGQVQGGVAEIVILENHRGGQAGLLA